MPNHPSYVSAVIVPTLVFTLEWIVIGLTLFGLLHWMLKAQKQPFWRSDMKTDLAYWFLAPFLYGYVVLVARRYAVDYGHLDRIVSTRDTFSQATNFGAGRHHLAPNRPAAILGASAIPSIPAMALPQHSSCPMRVDWLTSVRIHPVNFLLYSTLINLLIGLLDFSAETFFFLVPFNMLDARLAHANLNWTFGPFRYVIASPVFHRWHHTHADQGGNKNFAPTFPFLDIAFGTFYMPKGQLPSFSALPIMTSPIISWGSCAIRSSDRPLSLPGRGAAPRKSGVMAPALAEMHIANPNANGEAD